MVPCEHASKQAEGAGISSPPANTWIFRRPPLMSSAIFALSSGPSPGGHPAPGVHVVDMRHWNLGWAITFGASANAAAVAPAATAPFMRNVRRSIALLQDVD